MIISKINHRILYGQVDEMGYMYYGNYPLFYEMGRTELLRMLGISIKQLAGKGILLPAITMDIKYIKPVFYDELITIITMVKEIPKTRLKFYFEIFSEQKDLINTGSITFAFINKMSRKPKRAPVFLVNKFKNFKK
jgi:acyl-CoA thioester hydrolase